MSNAILQDLQIINVNKIFKYRHSRRTQKYERHKEDYTVLIRSELNAEFSVTLNFFLI